MSWIKKQSTKSDWFVHLECLCADDFGAGYKDQEDLTPEDISHTENYEDTRYKHSILSNLASKNQIECNVQDSDDRDSRHSDAYLYFYWSEVDKVLKILQESGVSGDILDVPKDFPIELENKCKSLGWSVERRL